MEPEAATILPKGIVHNTKEIYDEVAKHPIVPMDRVWQIWRVYTTTNKKLRDPTARRLENFWWHVLGSDRRLLNGPVLASLYENISLGPTFVALTPPNQLDGDNVSPLLRQALSIINGQKPQAQEAQPTPSTDSGPESPDPDSAIDADNASKSSSSSAARPPPSHPILKKPRGPSTSGPRPTARFVSPPLSEMDEDDANIVSSGSTVTPSYENRAPIMSPSRKKPATPKKFVASTASAKRRPAVVRRTSSQAAVPTTSDMNSASSSRDGGSPSSGGNRGSATPLRSVSPIVEGVSTAAKSPASASPTPRLSEKAAGKRPAIHRRSTQDGTTRSRNQLSSNSSSSSLFRPEPVSARSRRRIKSSADLSTARSEGPTHYRNAGAIASAMAPPDAAADTAGSSTNATTSTSRSPGPATARSSTTAAPSSSRSPGPVTTAAAPTTTKPAPTSPTSPAPQAPPMTHSRSHSGYFHRRGNSSMSLGGLFTGAAASTTNVAVQGTIIDQSGSIPTAGFHPGGAGDYFDQRHDPASRDRDHAHDPAGPRPTSHFTPTLPSSAASVPLGRTKSQLTLLLENDARRHRQ